MQHVRVRITADGREDEIHPMYDLLANAPFVDRATALQWNFSDGALGILHDVQGDRKPFETAVDGIPEVLEYDLEVVGDRRFYVYVRDATTESLAAMFGPVTTGGLIVVPPTVYHGDGTVSVSIFGPQAEFQEAMDRVPDLIEVTVESVGGLAATPGVTARLSDRQREAIVTAFDRGYYDVPKTASQEDVAAAMDCSPSTAAEHLQKAEATLVQSFLGR